MFLGFKVWKFSKLSLEISELMVKIEKRNYYFWWEKWLCSKSQFICNAFKIVMKTSFEKGVKTPIITLSLSLWKIIT